MSIKDNFPSVGPSLSLNFARSKTLDPRITFSRTNQTATYMNENGLIVTAAADEPRFDHKYENGVVKSLGLLVEEQRSNLVTYNEDLSQWTPNAGGTITSNDTVSPDGNTTADKVTQTNEVYSGVHSSAMSGIATNTVYSCSVFIKPDGDTQTRFGFLTSGSWQGSLDTNWSSGEPSTASSQGGASDIVYEEYPNGWYRASFKASTQSNAFAGAIYFHCHPDRTGTGKSAWFWGAQLEAGSFPTSYIPTSSSQATRSPDNVSMTGTNFSDWFNSSEGTLYASASILGKNIHTTGVEYPNGICKISDTGSSLSYSRVLYFGGNADPDRVSFGNRDSSSSITAVDNTFGDIQSNQYYKVCGAYINNDEQALCFNGRDIKFNGTDVNPPTPNQLLIGTGYNGGIAQAPGGDEMYLNGHISQLTYYPKRLTNTQLQTLTK